MHVSDDCGYGDEEESEKAFAGIAPMAGARDKPFSFVGLQSFYCTLSLQFTMMTHAPWSKVEPIPGPSITKNFGERPAGAPRCLGHSQNNCRRFPMKKTFLAAAAAGVFALSAVAFSGKATAQCYWTGFDWACATAPMHNQQWLGYYYDPHWAENAIAQSRNYPMVNPGFPPAGDPAFPGPRPYGGGVN
jgi:hypothetical protein